MERHREISNHNTSKSSSNSLHRPPFFQAKLTVNQPGDAFEREADSMADQVMRMPAIESEKTFFSASETTPKVQRKCAECGAEEKKVQRKSLSESITPIIQMKGGGGNEVSEMASARIASSKGGGNTMDATTNSFMSNRFGNDFSGVKIHTNEEAVQLSRELNARAFTVGNDIYFNQGEYQPNTDTGKHLLAHELTHTVQQGGGETKAIQRDPEPVDAKKDVSTKLTADQVTSLITSNNKSTVSKEALLCLIWKESGFNPEAKSSKSSATGLMAMTKGAVAQVNDSTPKGVHFEHSDMTNASKNIECGTYYIQIRIDWADGDLKKGMEGFGTGSGYADNILKCGDCITADPTATDSCLKVIHQ